MRHAILRAIAPLPFILLTFLLPAGVHAQDALTPLQGGELQVVEADLKNRLSKSLPESESDLVEERNWIRNMKSRVARTQFGIESEKRTHSAPKEDMERLKGELMVVVEKVKAVNCENTPLAQQKLKDAYSAFTSMRSGYSHIIDAAAEANGGNSREWLKVEGRFDELAAFFVTNGKRPSKTFSQGSCAELVSLFNEASFQADIDSYFGARRHSFEESEADLVTEAKSLADVNGDLTSYENAIDEAIADAKNKRSALDNLYIIVLILVVLSVGSIGMIRIFPPDLMKEWVESGQVIQFVTVTIILIVIVVLGLTGLLSENSLGTLLGGIGGYVLSQGVGRAAARNAERNKEKAAAKEAGSSEEGKDKPEEGSGEKA